MGCFNDPTWVGMVGHPVAQEHTGILALCKTGYTFWRICMQEDSHGGMCNQLLMFQLYSLIYQPTSNTRIVKLSSIITSVILLTEVWGNWSQRSVCAQMLCVHWQT